MDQSNVKRRDVWSFDEFAKSYDEARKVIMLKPGEKAHPGSHTISGKDSPHVRHDANPYKAFGIEHNAEEANIEDRMNANRVHIFDPTKNSRVETITQGQPLGEKSAALDTIVQNMQAAVFIDESEKFDISKLEKTVKIKEEDEEPEN